MKFYLLSLLLALLAFSQSYIWTKKKNEKKVVPVVRAPNDGDLPMHKELASTIVSSLSSPLCYTALLHVY